MAERSITRRQFATFATVAAAALAAGCAPAVPTGSTGSAASTASEGSISSTVSGEGLHLACGGESGVYSEFGRLVADTAATGIDQGLTTLVSNGAKANVELVAMGAADFAFCQLDVIESAREGVGAFADSPIDSFGLVAALYDEKFQIVTLDPKVRTVSDLKGKRVSVGALDSGTCICAYDVLGSYGLSEEDFTPAFLGFGDSAEALDNGWIDAAFMVAGVPTPAMTTLFESGSGAHLVALNDAHIAQLVELSGSYRSTVIPASSYAGQDKPVATACVTACLIAGDSVPEDEVHALVSGLFAAAGQEAHAQDYARYGALDAGAAGSLDPQLYHPGAARFFAESAEAASDEAIIEPVGTA